MHKVQDTHRLISAFRCKSQSRSDRSCHTSVISASCILLEFSKISGHFCCQKNKLWCQHSSSQGMNWKNVRRVNTQTYEKKLRITASTLKDTYWGNYDAFLTLKISRTSRLGRRTCGHSCLSCWNHDLDLNVGKKRITVVPQDQIKFYDPGKPVHNSSYRIKNLCPPLETKTSL